MAKLELKIRNCYENAMPPSIDDILPPHIRYDNRQNQIINDESMLTCEHHWIQSDLSRALKFIMKTKRSHSAKIWDCACLLRNPIFLGDDQTLAETGRHESTDITPREWKTTFLKQDIRISQIHRAMMSWEPKKEKTARVFLDDPCQYISAATSVLWMDILVNLHPNNPVTVASL
jgi:hypothetical protein